MIKYSEQRVTTIDGDWKPKEIQQWENDDIWSSLVRYVCVDADGKIIDTFEIRYTGEEYNVWFNGYNNGKFLLEELVRVKEWEKVEIPDSVEDDFLNHPKEEIKIPEPPMVEQEIESPVIEEKLSEETNPETPNS